ncbi:hypothetical protein [Azospirillum thermophilum]|uniref:Uncharacterized protein n=1 Tax=Azospirillum thermophilum TaxID=2202148 RepID=A0A2S2CM25_9PROT|nr:hypothetical protein [Azospirillum thermophilum]AWK85565.1 hypothetical protein DEW08_04740 [Azospirillum thermophilum]
MTKQHEQSPEHKRAHDLAEKALDEVAGGDVRKAREMIEEAKQIDPKIGEEMAREVAEDRAKAEKFGKDG